jgi:hypothetical protein
LATDGSVDLSRVPEHVRLSWQSHGEPLSVDGISDLGGVVMPADGERFLRVLLRRKVTASGVWFSHGVDHAMPSDG